MLNAPAAGPLPRLATVVARADQEPEAPVVVVVAPQSPPDAVDLVLRGHRGAQNTDPQIGGGPCGVAVGGFWRRDYVAAVAEAPSPARKPAAGKGQQPAAIEGERADENDRKGGRSGSGRRQTAGRQFEIGSATVTCRSRGRMER